MTTSTRAGLVLVSLAIVLLGAVVWSRLRGNKAERRFRSSFRRSERRMSAWFASRGPAGLAVLGLIGLCLLFVASRGIGRLQPRQAVPAGAYVVRIAPFVVDGPDQRTGAVVADQLVQALASRFTTPINVARLPDAITTVDEARAAAASNHADVIVWGAVASGAQADAPALRPRLTWIPTSAWEPQRWVGSEQWTFAQHFELARAPLNGTAVLPPLLDSLHLVQTAQLDPALTKLAALRRDYGDVLSAELPASLEAFMLWGQGLNDAAENAARAARDAAPNAPTWNNLGVVLAEQGRADAARAAWTQALALDPNLAQAHGNRGRSLLTRGPPPEALAELQAAVNAGDNAALPLVAVALRRGGALGQARTVVGDALQARPSDPVALSEQALLALTNVETTTGRLEWTLEERPTRSAAELEELRGQVQTIADQNDMARTTALQQAAAFGAAGQPAQQRLAEMQARRLEAQQPQSHYLLTLINIERGRLVAAHPPNTFMRFWNWIRGIRTPLQQAAAFAVATQQQTTDPQLQYDLRYQAGRANYLEADHANAQTNWAAAATLTNTAELARQPEVAYGTGRVLLGNGQLAAARAAFEQASTIAPAYGPAHQQLLQLARNEKRWADAETELRWLLREQPSAPLTLELTDVLRQQGRLADAETLLLPLATNNNADALVALGTLYRSAGQLDGATTVLNRALAINKNDAAALEELAAVTLARPNADVDAAEAYLRQALAVAPGRVSAHVALAQLLIGRGQPAAAAKEFEAAVAINSDDPAVYRRLGEVLLESGQPVPAADSFRRALRLAPNSHESHHGLAMALLAQGRPKDAQAEEATTLRLANNNYTLALVGMGDIEQAQGALDEAIKHYQAALEHDPNIAGAFRGLGEVALKQGAPPIAVGRYQRGLEANPNDLTLLLGLGKAQLQSGDPAAAEQTFRQAQERNGGNAQAFAGAGQALWKQGRTTDALAQFQQAVALNPNDADAWLALGEIEAATNQLEAALQSYERVAKTRPQWHEPHYRRGVLLLENNQAAAAVVDLQAAVRLNDDFPQGHYWLGRAYRATNALADAERQLRRTVERDPNYYEARFFLARVLDERGKGADAKTALRDLLAAAPADNQWHAEAERELARLGP